MFKKGISLFLSLSLIITQPIFAQGVAQLNLAQYLGQGHLLPIDIFRPAQLRYFSYDEIKNSFQILLDKGDAKDIKDNQLKQEAKELMDYFLIGLTLPNDAFWVNLRPDSQDNIIDPELEKTDLGRILLEADLQLKKDTAGLTSPQTPEGKAYWDKLYKKAGELFGTENIPIPTITRPWIVPGEIIVRESGNSAYIYKATLKVMLEEDYLVSRGEQSFAPTYQEYAFSDSRMKELNKYSTQLIQELIIPKLIQEVNSNKRYAKLRQAYYSLVLSRWFKMRFAGKSGQYADLIDRHNLTNLIAKEPYNKLTYFKQYQESFAQGEYNLKEPVYTSYGQSIRAYMSGGFDGRRITEAMAGPHTKVVGSPVEQRLLNKENMAVLDNNFKIVKPEQPMALAASPLTDKQFMEQLLQVSEGGVGAIADSEEFKKFLLSLSNAQDIAQVKHFLGEGLLINRRKYQKSISELMNNSYEVWYKTHNPIINRRIVFLGPPGAGKGTQAAEFAKRFGIAHISTGALLREEVANKTDLGNAARKYMAAGKLVPDNLILDILIERLRKDDAKEGFILDGYPRNEEQAKALDKLFEEKKLFLDLVLDLQTEVKNIIERVSGRRVCKICNATYHISNIPPKVEGRCDKDGGELRQREDDNKETVSKRINVYNQETKPLIAYYLEQGKLYSLNANGAQDEVFGEIAKTVKDYDLNAIKQAVQELAVGVSQNEWEGIKQQLEKTGCPSAEINKHLEGALVYLKAIEGIKALESLIPGAASPLELASLKRAVNLFAQKLMNIAGKEGNVKGSPDDVAKIRDDLKKLTEDTLQAFDSLSDGDSSLDFLDELQAAREMLSNGVGVFIADLDSGADQKKNEISSQYKYLLKEFQGIEISKYQEILEEIVVRLGNDYALSAELIRHVRDSLDDYKVEIASGEYAQSQLSGKEFLMKRIAVVSDKMSSEDVITEEAKLLVNAWKQHQSFAASPISVNELAILKRINISEITQKPESALYKKFIAFYESMRMSKFSYLSVGDSILENYLSKENAFYDAFEYVLKDAKVLNKYNEIDSKACNALYRNDEQARIMLNKFKGFIDEYVSTRQKTAVVNIENKEFEQNFMGEVIIKIETGVVIKGKTHNRVREYKIIPGDYRSYGWNYFSKKAIITEKGWESDSMHYIELGKDLVGDAFGDLIYSSDRDKVKLKDDQYRIGYMTGMNKMFSGIAETERYKDTVGYVLRVDYMKEGVFRLTVKRNSNMNITIKYTPVSSGLIVKQKQLDDLSGFAKGGIDFTDKAMKIGLERMGSFADLKLILPEITNVAAIDLDNEFKQIQLMASSGIRPSDTRILEFTAACYYRGEFGARLGEITACLQQAHFLDERLGRESSPALRLATILPEVM